MGAAAIHHCERHEPFPLFRKRRADERVGQTTGTDQARTPLQSDPSGLAHIAFDRIRWAKRFAPRPAGAARRRAERLRSDARLQSAGRRLADACTHAFSTFCEVFWIAPPILIGNSKGNQENSATPRKTTANGGCSKRAQTSCAEQWHRRQLGLHV